MAVSYADAKELREHLATVYGQRHADLKKLRNYWHGRYWDMDAGESHPLTSVFRDTRSPMADTGPDVKLVHNILQMVCVKYQTFLSNMPQIRVYVDPPLSEAKRKQARTKERFLYGLWSENNANHKLNNMAWYLPLMGHSYLGIFPDFDKGMPKMLVRTPEYAYPVPGFENSEDATIFHWEIDERWVKRDFPQFTSRQKQSRTSGRKVEIMEYSGKNCFYRWADDQMLNGIEHNLGFNLFQPVKFIDVPDEAFGHGAVEQIVNMNEMTNAMMSLLFQIAIDYAFPMLVLEDPSKAPETIAKGPGAVLPLNPGGRAEFLHPPVQALGIQQAFVERAEFNIKQASGMPDVNFGVSPASSIVTGAAINELQGAGTGSTIEMVQGNGLGPALVSWNEKAIVMGQRLFKDREMRLYGYDTPGVLEVKSTQFALSVKGSELKGSPRNEVVFNPAMSMHDKLVMNLQAMGAGLVSKEHSRNQMGIPDSEAMDEEIMAEKITEGVLAAYLMELQQDPSPENAQVVEAEAVEYLSGDDGPHPLLAKQMPQMMPGQPSAPNGAPTGASMPMPAQASPDGQPQAAAFTVESVQLMLEAVPFNGRVFLVGQIVDGPVNDEVEISVTDPTDRQLIVQNAPELDGRVIFHVIRSEEPAEDFVEVQQAASQIPTDVGGA